ncbi:hypothetical protein KRE28_13205 [Elizabethkingia meningoseptica]|uniref:hypothetical protein n=1 Tax=Elizabethkingia meningoseptica TaxID=238 RepID=UPI0023AFB6CA|nr:hypothetical protein [Elizabethkingia meningoseptica]MDE5482774.1 hypothetical protein [Elizabethkingia meningoseptica]
MVTIINYKERQREDGTSFYVLEVHGGIEMVKSQTTGQFYATSKKAYIPSTFDELTCKALIGTQMQGSITREECEPYEYTIKDTGEIITLFHRFVYTQEEQNNPYKESTQFETSIENFSRNGRAVEFA